MPSRTAQGEASFQLWLVTVVLGALVGSLWLVDTSPDLTPWVRLYVLFALLSSVATLALVPGLGFLAAGHWLRSPRAVAWVQSLLSGLFLGLLYTDTIIYRLLGHHFNGAVINVLSTRGSGDAIHLGPRVWLTASSGVVGLTLAFHWLRRIVLRNAVLRQGRGKRPMLVLRPRFVALALLLPIVFIEKSVYAAAEITRDREVTNAARALPLYPKVRLGRFIADEDSPAPQFELLASEGKFTYPAELPTFDPEGPRPNIVVLVIDSWRRDSFSEELTPSIKRFAEGARVFENHISGGNGTRFGLFSILYGLHGSYWFHALETRRPPVILEALEGLGYELRVFSSASMNFPEFRDTAWVDVLDRLEDDYPAEHSWQRDELLAQSFDRWLTEREGSERPFFSFILLDSPHQPYENPGGPYQPTVDELDYIELAVTTDSDLVEKVHNRYKNSVLHMDRVAARIFDSLERAGGMENTIAVVTSDHGEEFQECGFWGHTSSFSPPQIEVPFFVRGPGVTPGVETRPTAHVDVASSLLELLGADPARRAGYSLGYDLFAPVEERARVVAGWAYVGLWSEHGIFRVPLATRAEPEVYDRSWRMLPDVDARSRAARAELERMARECSRFLRVP